MLWVLDASVAVKWFFTDEQRRGPALAVRRTLASQPRQFVVPHLFLSEVVHVLARKSGQDEAFIGGAMALILRLGLRVVALDAVGWQLCAQWCARGASGYDATYLALAEGLGGRWVTDDHRAAQKAQGRALVLAEWPTA